MFILLVDEGELIEVPVSGHCKTLLYWIHVDTRE